VAYSLFCRSAAKWNCYENSILTRKVAFAGKQYVLDLPLRFKQNWTILFEDFRNRVDGNSLAVFRRYARDARLIYEIGTNAGLYLYFAAAERHPKTRIFCFEPNPLLSALLKQNVERNGLDRIEIIEAAVSRDDGIGSLFLTNTDLMSSLSQDFLIRSGRPVRADKSVRIVSVDNFAVDHDAEPDLIKIDVEGLEADVLAGAACVLNGNSPTLLLEITEGNQRASFVSKLVNMGYRCFYIIPRGLIPIEGADDLARRRVPSCENYLFTMRPELVSDLIVHG
jgi:FkbM family methyltransferase